MTPALAALLAECEGREPRLVAIIRAMDEDRDRLYEALDYEHRAFDLYVRRKPCTFVD